MKIVRHSRSASDTAIAIGSFDGVHRGHRAMLAHVGEAARARGISAAALTVEPLPREYFAPLAAPARLSSLAEKLAAIAASGIEIAFVERFAAPFAAMTAAQFESRLALHHRPQSGSEVSCRSGSPALRHRPHDRARTAGSAAGRRCGSRGRVCA